MTARYMTLDDIMTELGIAKSTASVLVRRSMLHFRDGEVIRVPREAFDRYLASRMVPPQEAPTFPAKRTRPKPKPTSSSSCILRATQPRRKTGT